MAAFFPSTIYNTEASFTPLFRLLNDFDSYSRQCDSAGNKKQNGRKSTATLWQPKFDVRETPDAYELHGELAGLNKNDVSIEFTEPQTLVVRGKVERTYSSSGPDSSKQQKQLENQKSTTATSDTSNSHKATVADEGDVSVQEESQTSAVAAATAVPVDSSKYWLRERSVGEFARSFGFPSRVDQDGVTASFQDGVLSISVPKTKKHEPVRISIQ